MPKPKTVRAYFDALDPHQFAIARGLEDQIKTRWPLLRVKLAWGFPCWTGNERIFSIIAYEGRCNLQLWQGTRLAESYYGRIEGAGKKLRHVKVYDPSDIDDELIDIMEQAVTLDKIDPVRVD